MQLSAAALNSRRRGRPFIDITKRLARKLDSVQTNPAWPGGVLFFITGRAGELKKKFFAVIKAEPDKAISLDAEEDTPVLHLIENMLLSNTQKLYKIGLLYENNTMQPDDNGFFNKENYDIYLFDQMFSTLNGGATSYFYSGFLGAIVPPTSRQLTTMFYKGTMNYIDTCGELDSQAKADQRNHLRSELRNNDVSINVTAFAGKYLPEEIRDDYIDFMVGENVGLPRRDIVKDINQIKKELRKPRSARFSSGVTIHTPKPAKGEEEINNVEDYYKIGESRNGWTQVEVRGTLTSQI